MKLPRWWAKPSQLPSDFAAIASAYRGSTPRFPVSHQQQSKLQPTLQASTQGDLQGLMALLAKDVYWSDGGGQVAAALKPLQGGNESRSFLLALRSKWLSTSVVHVIEINGQPGMIALVDAIQCNDV